MGAATTAGKAGTFVSDFARLPRIHKVGSDGSADTDERVMRMPTVVLESVTKIFRPRLLSIRLVGKEVSECESGPG